MLGAFLGGQKHEPRVKLSVSCKIGDGRPSIRRWQLSCTLHIAHAHCSAQSQFQHQHRVVSEQPPAAGIPGPGTEQSRNVKATSARPVAPPPPAAAQAAAPNRQQNAGTKNPIRSVLTKNPPIPGTRPHPIDPPIRSPCSRCTVTAARQNTSRRACSRSFTGRPAGAAAAAD